MKSPNIVISKLDLQRLDKILDPLKYPLDLLEALENEIDRARIVGHKRIQPNVVTMNSKVHVLDETTSREFVVTLVYPQDAGAADTVSILAPVGTALLGLKTGQCIEWRTPQCRPLKLKVLEVLYQPEANMDYDL
ncbi:nucleoside diphosphate kinase regulator [Halopseudomonas sp.]|uniref:nucleoside diphosphate kinase regulator n=1 Tax=Halopseudomonas sp. TaxID=2901191 RepID=UPI0035664556